VQSVRFSSFRSSFSLSPLRKLAIAAISLVTLLSASYAPAAAAQYAGIVIDAKTGEVLYSSDADGRRYPASLTKMMTLYLTFEALEAGRMSLDTSIPVSAHAASEPPSKLGVPAGRTITVRQAIQSLVTRSANDMATALGEYLGGSETGFARMMTNKARSLGMTRTVYRNANGLPDTQQYTTAHDQAILGIALRQHFPQYYDFFSTRSFKYGKQTIGNHNRLLGKVRGVDGIKTGYTRASGFNLATSAQVGNRSIVGVVLGGTSGASRDAKMRQLVEAYLPKAKSTSRVSFIIPRAGTNAVAMRKLDRLDNAVPVPQQRYDVEVASNAYAPPVAEDRAVAAISNGLVEEGTDEEEVADVVPMPAPVPAHEETKPNAVDHLQTASTTTPSGWVIQVGTSPDRDLALGLLHKAQAKGGKVLRSATPFTVAFENSGQKVYRARFGGFSGQTSAVNACRSLKRAGVGCWASQQ
jgi:D-alanyl-D-alanine carboxypeptidase